MHGSYVLVSDIPNRSALDFVFVFAEIYAGNFSNYAGIMPTFSSLY